MASVLSNYGPRVARSQSVPIDPRQVRNSAGGYTFTIDREAQLRRFLVLGADGGTYYASERQIARSNVNLVTALGNDPEFGRRLIEIILEVSEGGLAPRVEPQIFALAVAASSPNVRTRQLALAALPRVCRTATHLFIFLGFVKQFRGWGRALKSAVADWYTDKPVAALTYQMVKYRSRESWTHRDALRLAKPAGVTGPRKELLAWATGHEFDRKAEGLKLLDAWLKVQEKPSRAVKQIDKGLGLSWEMLPNEALSDPEVWRALIMQRMPITALMRQLPRLTRLGVLNGGETLDAVTSVLTDPEALRGGRVHPLQILLALRTYTSGRSLRGDTSWSPNPAVSNALDRAFYASFSTLRPAGKRVLIGLDVSGSMGAPVAGLPITSREATAAMAMAQVATEPWTEVVGFTGNGTMRGGTALRVLDFTTRRRLDDIVAGVAQMNFGRTDCALPMRYATATRKEVDLFCVYTDNETWHGDMHPHQALQEYRRTMGIDAKLVVLATTATPFTIADPSDPGMLDMVGLDASAPGLIASFANGL